MFIIASLAFYRYRASFAPKFNYGGVQRRYKA
jgi:hypothetical protein